MPINYQRKFVECMKVYHELHGILGWLTMSLNGRVDSLKIPAHCKSYLKEIAFEGADKIREVDLKYRDLVRTDWIPPELCVDLTHEDCLELAQDERYLS